MEGHSNKLCADSKIPNISTVRAILVSVWEAEHQLYKQKQERGKRKKVILIVSRKF